MQLERTRLPIEERQRRLSADECLYCGKQECHCQLYIPIKSQSPSGGPCG